MYKTKADDWTQAVPRVQIDGLVQERRNSIANALDLRRSCINLSKCCMRISC